MVFTFEKVPILEANLVISNWESYSFNLVFLFSFEIAGLLEAWLSIISLQQILLLNFIGTL